MKPLHLSAAFVSALLLSAPVSGQTWNPERPVRFVVPFAAGAAADNGFRAISEKLAVALGQPIVIDNRPGAGGVLGAEVGAKAPPDGYTLVAGSDPPFTINPHLMKLPFDPLKDFAPVSLVANLPIVLVVRSDLEINSLQQLVDRAKVAPGKYTMASSGNGSSGHLAAEMLKAQAGIDLLHVPYKGIPQALTDMLGGRADLIFSSLGPIMPHVKSGKLKMLAISTKTRLPTIPEVPTVAESGYPDFDLSVWLGLLYPAGTPAAAIERMSAEVDKVLRTPEVQARFSDLGYVPVGGPPARLAERIQSDYQRFGKLIRDARIKSD